MDGKKGERVEMCNLISPFLRSGVRSHCSLARRLLVLLSPSLHPLHSSQVLRIYSFTVLQLLHNVHTHTHIHLPLNTAVCVSSSSTAT